MCAALFIINLFIVRISDYRHSSADKPYLNTPQSIIQDRNTLISLPSSKSSQQTRTAHLQGRHSVVNYDNQRTFHREQPTYWTLPKNTASTTIGIENKYHTMRKPSLEAESSYERQNTENNSYTQSANNESVRISPIDPRTSGTFKSSTPSKEDNIIDLSNKLLSPVKSTMTNDELYAVIHKSKKKLNIKDSIERSDSPALSNISLSPVTSETSLLIKGTQKHPETGYLIDPRNRNSWAYSSEKPNYPMQSTYSRGLAGIKTESTCADRYGPIPQTSRLDFKKLLLQHSVKTNTLNPQKKPTKLSAVEQLKLSKDKNQVTTPTTTSHVNILDLSGSPKTYSHRRLMKINPQPSSPGRTSTLIKEHKSTPKILLSPKSQWRFSSPRSDVLNSPIPEANNEDDNSNSSGEKADISPNTTVKTIPIVTNQRFGARRNLIPINENSVESETIHDIEHDVVPIANIDFSNATRMSRSEILQAKRAEFFNSSPESSPPRISSFKAQTINSRNETSPDHGKSSPTTLETAL